MKTATEEKLVDSGGGVMCTRGGYATVGNSLELPSVSGSRQNQKQDVTNEEALLRIDVYNQEGKVKTTTFDPIKRKAVSSKVALSSKRDVAVTSPRTPQDVVVPATAPNTKLVGVSFKHRSSGFSFSFPADVVIEGEPVDAVRTLAIGVSGQWEYVSLPKGEYTIIAKDLSDSGSPPITYNAFFGNQCFQSDLKYIIFILLDGEG